MTTEQTLLFTVKELRTLMAHPDADVWRLLALVKDTDAYHRTLSERFATCDGETFVSFEARER